MQLRPWIPKLWEIIIETQKPERVIKIEKKKPYFLILENENRDPERRRAKIVEKIRNCESYEK